VAYVALSMMVIYSVYCAFMFWRISCLYPWAKKDRDQTVWEVHSLPELRLLMPEVAAVGTYQV